MAELNKNKMIPCRECNNLISTNHYKQHILTDKHKTALKEYYKNEIDFLNNRIYFSSSSILEFFNSAKKYFYILANHIILEHTSVLIDVYLFVLYNNESSNEEKNISKVNGFCVNNMVLTKEINIHCLHEKLENSFMSQIYMFLSSNHGCVLEEMVFMELNITKKIHENDRKTILQDESIQSHINNNVDELNNNSKKTEPLQLVRCQPCGEYIVQNNYELHITTTLHKLSSYYSGNDEMQINRCSDKDDNVKCRILSPTSGSNDSIENFFNSVKTNILTLVNKVLEIREYNNINIGSKVFALYDQDNDLKSNSENLGQVKAFAMKNEILTPDADLLIWYETIPNAFKSINQTFLKDNPVLLTHILFLDMYFG